MTTKVRAILALPVFLVCFRASHRFVDAAPADWPQWGGPNRNFVSDATGLASSWPAGGPKKLWTRALGEGHSAIVLEGGRLYTMYRPLSAGRRGQEEKVAAIDAATGDLGIHLRRFDYRHRLLGRRRPTFDAVDFRRPALRRQLAA